MNQAPVTIGAAMSPRPVFHEDLGLFFKELRELRGWESQRQAATIAKNRKIAGVSYQILQRLESGRTKNPEPQLLRALAELYDVPFEAILAAVLRHRYGLTLSGELIRQGLERQSGVSNRGGPVDETTSARMLERLETEIRDEEKAVREMRRLATELAATATRRGESLATARKETSRRRSR